MIENLRRVTCDRCGRQVVTASTTRELFLSEFTRQEAGLDGWEPAEGGRHLCPECSAEYRKLKSRQAAEIEAFLSA